jgi:transcriptional regulator with XRE-family HTH domain
METFGERLKRLRKERKLTVNHAAKAAGIKQQVLDRLERRRTLGNVQAWTIQRLADLYQVRMEYLCFNDAEAEAARDATTRSA